MATVKLELVGSADGAPIELVGTGATDPGAGQLALQVRTSRRLLLSDPALVALGLLDVLVLAATYPWPEPSPGSPYADVHVRSRTDLYDEQEREAGGWRVVAALSRTHGHVRLAGQLLDHVARIEPGERVVAVDAPWAALAQKLEPEGVLLAGAWDARTSRGNGYRGVVTALVDGPFWYGPEQTIQVRLDEIKIRWPDQGPGEVVKVDAAITERHQTGAPR